MPRVVYELDGAQFQGLASFARHFSAVVLREHAWNGNLDAFNDILRGGFGTPKDGFALRVRNVAAARSTLGYPETARWFEEHSKTCHTDRAVVNPRMVLSSNFSTRDPSRAHR